MSSGDSAKKEDTTISRKVPLSIIPITPFGKYTLIGKLGHGGMAEVYLSYVAGPAGFRKLCVIKRLHPHLEDEPGFLDMFLDEARLAARLNHPNVVQTYEVGEVDASHFIAMEYLEGQGLDRIRQRCIRSETKLPPPVVANLVVEALEGLNYAHNLKDFDGADLGVIHRDVSPQNVFVSYEGAVKLLDFGIAKAATHVVETRTGIIKGKFAYIAPEQARGGELDNRADIWSMGVVLWETLARRRLFKGPNDVATLSETLTGMIPSIREFDDEIPEELEAIVMKSLTRDRSERYQTALEMRDDLKQYLITHSPRTSREEVSTFVKGLFSDVIAQNKRVLQLCLSDATAEHGLSTGEFRMLTQTPSGELAMNTPSSGATPSTPTSQSSGVVRLGTTPTSLQPPSNSELTPQTESGLTQSQARRRTFLWVLAVLLIIPAAGLIGWGLNRNVEQPDVAVSTPLEPQQETPPQPVPVQSLVTLTSTPAGAQVHLGDNILGRTPIKREIEQLPRGAQASFIFRLDGHDDITINTSLRESRVRVHADFIPLATKTLPPDEEPTKQRRPPFQRPTPRARSSKATTQQNGATKRELNGAGDQESSSQTGSTKQAGTAQSGEVSKEPSRPRIILDDEQRRNIPIID